MVAMIDARELAGVVELACHAPSVHNSQPWRLVASDGELRVFSDRERVPHATDLSGREAIISCGALLDHLRVAAAAAGWQTTIARFPNPNDLDHLATVRFRRVQFVTDAQKARAEAIRRRHTDRLPLEAPTAWPAFEIVLRSAVDSDDAVLQVLPASARPLLAEASRLTESLRRYDSSYHAELQWWTAPSEVSEGMPYSVLASAAERDRVDIARAFPSGITADRRPEVRRDQSVVVALSTYGDTRKEALGCGEALSTVLLEATMADYATCTLTHLMEVPASRGIVEGILSDLPGGAGRAIYPQLLVRIGQAPESVEMPHTPRRPLAEVLDFASTKA